MNQEETGKKINQKETGKELMEETRMGRSQEGIWKELRESTQEPGNNSLKKLRKYLQKKLGMECERTVIEFME